MAAPEWSERTRMIVTAAIVVVINGGLGGWLYMIHSDYQKYEATHKTKQKRVNELKAVVAEKPEKELQLKTLKGDYAKLESKLPEEQQIGQLIDEMSTIATKTNCQRKSATLMQDIDQATVAGATYSRSVWKTRWEADFFGWCKLMNEMEERFQRFVTFENFSLQPKANGMVPTGSKHEINVDVVTYRYIRR